MVNLKSRSVSALVGSAFMTTVQPATMKRFLRAVALVVTLVQSYGVAHAGFIIQPTQVEANKSTGWGNLNYIINGAGLASALATNDPVPAAFPIHAGGSDFNSSGQWETVVGVTPTDVELVFDLGAIYTVGGLHVWTGNEFTNYRGVKDFKVSFSTTSGTAGFGSAQAFRLLDPQRSASYRGESFFLTAGELARWVRFDVDSNFNGGNSVQLSEVRFFTADDAPVPIPATVALLGLGLVGIGAARRKQA